jgi:quinoprotein glucose dehydrogenase
MPATPLRLDSLAVVLALLVTVSGCQATGPRGAALAAPDVEWPTYGGTHASARYSPLAQITRVNVRQLRVAWRWRSPDHDIMARNPSVETYVNEATPLMIRGVLYVSTSLSQVAAIDAATGQTLWVHDPKVWTIGTPPNLGWVHRGVAYWTDGRDERIFIGTGNAYLIALDARTGTPIRSFGTDGRLDLTEGLGRLVDRLWYSVTSPPVVVRDVVVVGASIHDFPIAPTCRSPVTCAASTRAPAASAGSSTRSAARRGRERHMERESWKTVGGVNVGAHDADEELGYVYLPVSTPANDYYGGHRPGDNLFAESLVCLDAATGRRVWHFQVVRHPSGITIPAAPNLVDITVSGQRIKAVAQVTKQGFAHVFDRVTGRPGVARRGAAGAPVPGARRADPATQPVPDPARPASGACGRRT